MALYQSTGLRNDIASYKARVTAFFSGTTGDYNDNGASPDTITRDSGNFITDGFAPGDLITTKNSTTAGNDKSAIELVNVEATTLTIATGNLAATEAFKADTCVIACRGGSLLERMKDGVIRIYSGDIPASADASIGAATLLVEISQNSLTFAAGAFANGLEMGAASSGAIAKAAAETWSGVIVATGSAAFFRWVGNATDTGALSTTLPRVQGTCGVGSSYNLNLTSTSLVTLATLTIDTWQFTFPAA